MRETLRGASLSEIDTKLLDRAVRRDIGGCGKKTALECFATADVALGKLGDGVIVMGDSADMCGATGNCAISVYVREKNRYRLVLGGEKMGEPYGWAFAVVPSKRAIPDLVFAANSSVGENDLTLFRYIGDKFVERACERLLARGNPVTDWWDPSQVKVQPCGTD